MLIGQISSTYSLLRVNPKNSVIATATMINYQPQKWRLERKSETSRTFTSRYVE